MKNKCLFIASLFLGVFSSVALSGDVCYNVQDLDRNHDGVYEPGEVNPGQEYQTGPCVSYCPVTTFRPEYYTTTRCVPEAYTVPKQCCRYIPKYSQKTFCKMVPQYYTQQYCTYCPDYYCVPEVRYRQKTVCDTHCRYVPCSYVKRTCGSVEAPACNPCAPECAPACAPACNPCCN